MLTAKSHVQLNFTQIFWCIMFPMPIFSCQWGTQTQQAARGSSLQPPRHHSSNQPSAASTKLRWQSKLTLIPSPTKTPLLCVLLLNKPTWNSQSAFHWEVCAVQLTVPAASDSPSSICRQQKWCRCRSVGKLQKTHFISVRPVASPGSTWRVLSPHRCTAAAVATSLGVKKRTGQASAVPRERVRNSSQ